MGFYLKTVGAFLCSIILCLSSVKAQSGLCTVGTPFYTVDLTSSASATWTSTPPIVRSGSCCGSTSPDRCIEFQVTLNEDAIAINFEIASGAVPPGAMYYKIGCGPPTQVGQPICISGKGPHTITFCKPGSNLNTYRITSIPGPTGGPDVTTSDGCTATFSTYGLSGVTWIDITSGTGAYNSYLSCTSCTTTVVTPTGNYPTYVDYQVCGMPNLGPCAPPVMFCDTVRANFISPIANSINPNPAKYCQGTSGVNLTAVVNGGKGPYTYIWTNPSNTVVGSLSSYFASTVGTYSLEIRDALYPNCPSKFATTAVSIEPPPTVDAGNNVTVCASNATVSLLGTVANSNNYSWSGAGTFGSALTSLINTYTPSAAEIIAGKAVVKLTANGLSVCAAVMDSLVITINPVLDVSISAPSIVCYGEKATLTATISGGTPAYNFHWNTGSASASLSNMNPGIYTATVTDASFATCSDVDTVTILENPLLTLTVVDTVIIYCQTNTSVTAVASGGNGIYNYAWSSGDNSATANLFVGNYTIAVTDGVGCLQTKSTVVKTQNSNLGVTIATPPNVCYGASATVTPVVTSGFTPYTYSWNTGETTLSKTGSAGTYCITVTDSAGCVAAACVTINQDSLLVANVSGPTLICNSATGTMTASVSGGKAPYTYLWNTGESTASITKAAGTYTVTVSDANASTCAASKSFTLNQSTPLSVSLTPGNISCYGGSDGTVSATPSGSVAPYSYSWTPGGATNSSISGLAIGKYKVTVTSSLGCTKSDSVVLTQPPLLVVVIPTKTNVSCYGGNNGTAQAIATGGTAPYTYSWGTSGETTANATQLIAGTHTLTVTDAKGCVKTATVTITQPTALALSNSITHLSCKNSNNGKVTIIGSGGTRPYTYAWTPGMSTDSFKINLAAGTYSVLVTDAKGCTNSIISTVIEPDSLKFTLSGNNISCYNGSNGSITTAVTGGTTPYSYLWSDGKTTAINSSATAGTYTLAVNDAKGCSYNKSITLTQPTEIITAVSPDSYIRCDSLGRVYASASGGTGPLSVLWSNGTITDTNHVANSGAYVVTFTDANGCSKKDTAYVIPLASQLSINISGPSHICYGAPATLTSTISPGIPPYTTQWSTGATTASITVPGGNYCVTVRDNVGCVYSTCVNVIEDSLLQITATSDSVCYGAQTTVSAAATGGLAPYSYSWSGGGSGNTVSKGGGNHTATVSDATGCIANAISTVTEGSPLSITILEGSVSCFGYSDGLLQAQVSGSFSPYTYSWSNNQTGSGIYALPVGNYSVTVSDILGCTANASAEVHGPPSKLYPKYTATMVSCYGGNNGSATANAMGGLAPYSYLWWQGNSTSATANALSAGTYGVSITDSLGCVKDTQVVITQPTTLALSISPTMVSCKNANNGKATVLVSGGTRPYTYQWPVINKTDSAVSSLAMGTYTVNVTDAKGCTISKTVTIAEPDSLLATISKGDVSCYGGNNGQATVAATGGTTAYSYLWSNGKTTAANNTIVAGTYSVTVTDVKGCTYSKSVTITQPTQLNSTIGTPTPITCYGLSDGKASGTASGGTAPYSYLWTPSQETTLSATKLVVGINTFTVSDSKGCIVTKTVNITQPSPLATSFNSSDITCKNALNGSVEVLVGGGTTPYTYLWQNNSTTASLNNLAAGKYVVTVSDAYGCKKNDSIVIAEPDSLLISNITGTNISCFGGSNGSVAATVQGGTTPYSYQWSNGASLPNISGISSGTYSITVTDQKGCSTNSSIALTQPGEIITTVSPDAYIRCDSTGAVYASATGGTGTLIYSWSNGVLNDTSAVSNSGSYLVSVSDSLGCTVVDTAFVKPLGSSLELVLNAPAHTCFGDSAQITSTILPGIEPFSILWSTGDTTAAIKVLAGSYNATVTDAVSCAYTAYITVVEDPLFTVSVANDTVCYGANTTLNAITNGGYGAKTFAWNTGGTGAFISKGKGNHIVNVTDATGCKASDTAEVVERTPLKIDILEKGLTCFGEQDGQLTASATGSEAPYQYSWNNGDTTAQISNLLAGTYTVTVNDSKGCTQNKNGVVDGAAAPLSLHIMSSSVSCYGLSDGSISLQVTGGKGKYTYSWSNNAGDTKLNSSLSAGTYFFSVSDSLGCTIDSSVVITQPSPLTITLSKQMISCKDADNGSGIAMVNGGSRPYTYHWLPNNSSDSSAQNLFPGTHSITVNDARGCSLDTSLVITEPDSLLATINSTNVSCYGGNNGSAAVSASGGTGSYQYSWSNNKTTIAINNLTAGNYTVTVSDNNACSYQKTVKILQPTKLNANATILEHISCFGLSDGSAFASASGGVSPYIFSWLPNNENNDSSFALVKGSNTVTVSDSNNCMATASVIVNEPPVLNSLINSASVSCKGGSNGTANLVVSGGTAPYNYLWEHDNSTSSSLSALVADTFYVQITDAHGCEKIDSVIITEPDSLLISNINKTDVSCFGGSNGSASSMVMGGTAPYQHQWSNGATLSSISNLSTGTFTLQINDAKGCANSKQVTITQPTKIVVQVSAPQYISCDSAGTVYASASGGTGALSYVWSNGIANDTAVVSNSGAYLVTVSDSLGCTETNTAVVKPLGSALELSLAASAHICFGDSAQITSTITPGVAPFKLLWNTGDTTASIKVKGGTYSATVTDASTCKFTASINVIEDSLLQVSVADDTVCFGAQASLNAIATGGFGSYSYEWSGGGSTASVNKSAGTYYLQISDATGCIASDSVRVTEGTALQLSFSTEDLSCFGMNDGSAKVHTIGGFAPYNFMWSNNINDSLNSNLIPNTYSVVVTDAVNCSVTGNAIVGGPTQALSINFMASNVSCFEGNNGSIAAQVSGGTTPYQYSWKPILASTSSISSLTAGDYQLLITDAHQCLDSAIQKINEAPQITSELSSLNVSCFGGSDGIATVQVSGGTPGYSYLWSNSSTQGIAINLSKGQYIVEITDANSCVHKDSVTIDEPSVLTAQVLSHDVKCYGFNDGISAAIANGGTSPYQYNWKGNFVPDSSVSLLSKGNYQVTIKDAKGCSINKSYIINEPDTMVMQIITTPITCYNSCNGVVLASVRGGNIPYTYAWTGVSAAGKDSIATGVCDGTFSVGVSDAKGCSIGTKNFTLLNPLPMYIDSILTENELCHNDCSGSIKLYSSGATLFSVSGRTDDTTGIFNNVCKGSYIVKVKNNTGCVDSGAVNIFTPDSLTIKAWGDTLICPDNTIEIYSSSTGGTGSVEFYWNDVASGQVGNYNDAPSVTKSYIVYAQDVNGCKSPLDTVIVSVHDSLDVIAYSDSLICKGDSAFIRAEAIGGDGNYNYKWSSIPTGTLSTQQSLFAVPEMNTQYIIKLNDQCSVSEVYDTIDITVVQPPKVDFEIEVVEKCLPGKVIYHLNSSQVDSTYSLLWNFGDGNSSLEKAPQHTYYTSGKFLISLQVTSQEGCVTEVAKKNGVTIFALPEADFTASTYQQTIHDPWFQFFDKSKEAISIEWHFGDSSSTSSESEPFHKYQKIKCYPVQLNVWNSNGCIDSVMKEVCVIDVYSFFAPNGFTPNHDGINDFFIPQFTNVDESTWHLMIFDRWGELIYETYDSKAYWNGRRDNNMREVQIDVYVWKIDHKDIWGNPHDYIGRVSVIR